MEESSSKPSSKVARKIIEKNRRIQMKHLYSQLNSIVTSSNASSSSKGPKSSLPDQIDQATNCIKKLQEDVENLKKTKESLADVSTLHNSTNNNVRKSRVQIDLHENGSDLQVVFITGSDCRHVLTQFIRILHEEHVEVLNASYSVDNNMLFHNIHAKVGESSNVARISERLNMYSH